MGLKHYNEWISSVLNGSPGPGYKFVDKQIAVDQYIAYMLIRTQSMFRWTGLPDSIPQRNLELMLQMNGFAAVAPVDGTLYAFCGGLGGRRNVYYEPEQIVIANPALNYNASLRLGEDAAFVRNDALILGLLPMASRYATHLAETDISLWLATVNSRLVSLLAASDDRTYTAAVKLLEDIRKGEQGVILTPLSSLDNAAGVQALPYSNEASSGTIKNLIEEMQYLKASWYNELGLNANWNAKRESLSAAESLLNDDALLPLVDDMLTCRRRGADEINRLYGTSITVELASSWEDNQIEIAEAQETEGSSDGTTE